MTWFLWITLGLLALDASGKLICLAVGETIQHSRRTMAIDVAINGSLCAWAVVLLFSR